MSAAPEFVDEPGEKVPRIGRIASDYRVWASFGESSLPTLVPIPLRWLRIIFRHHQFTMEHKCLTDTNGGLRSCHAGRESCGPASAQNAILSEIRDAVPLRYFDPATTAAQPAPLIPGDRLSRGRSGPVRAGGQVAIRSAHTAGADTLSFVITAPPTQKILNQVSLVGPRGRGHAGQMPGPRQPRSSTDSRLISALAVGNSIDRRDWVVEFADHNVEDQALTSGPVSLTAPTVAFAVNPGLGAGRPHERHHRVAFTTVNRDRIAARIRRDPILKFIPLRAAFLAIALLSLAATAWSGSAAASAFEKYSRRCAREVFSVPVHRRHIRVAQHVFVSVSRAARPHSKRARLSRYLLWRAVTRAWRWTRSVRRASAGRPLRGQPHKSTRRERARFPAWRRAEALGRCLVAGVPIDLGGPFGGAQFTVGGAAWVAIADGRLGWIRAMTAVPVSLTTGLFAMSIPVGWRV